MALRALSIATSRSSSVMSALFFFAEQRVVVVAGSSMPATITRLIVLGGGCDVNALVEDNAQSNGENVARTVVREIILLLHRCILMTIDDAVKNSRRSCDVYAQKIILYPADEPEITSNSDRLPSARSRILQ